MKFRPSFTLILLASLLAALLGLLVPVEVAHASGGSWSATSPLSTARAFPAATLLPNGKVLVAGGENSSSGTAFASAELYDPSSGSWSATGSSMSTARAFPTATLLPNGKVLVAGGFNGSTCTAFASAELYDPSSDSWSATGSMSTARFYHTATLLPNGKVLVAGGSNCSNIALTSAELYDPSSGSWSPTSSSMSTARAHHTATLLPNGKVLVAGGEDSSGNALASAELYDPSSDTWAATGSMSTARTLEHTATLLPNGKVLVAGGASISSSGFVVILASAELYDPSSGTWTTTGSMNVARFRHTATLLPNGQVLVAGGQDIFGTGFASAELYDPSSGSWAATGSMSTARVAHTATLLPNGQVLVAGDFVSSSAELFTPDTTPPVLSLPTSPITVDATSPQGATVTYTVTATDPDNPPSQLTISCSPASGSTFPIGTTTVNCTASDPAGNSTSSSFQVVVNDTDLGLTNVPNITTNATSPQGAVVTYPLPTAVDEDSSAPAVTCTPASGSTFPIGTTIGICTTVDSDDTNSPVSQSFTVTVNDTDLGLTNLPTNITTNATSPQGATVPYTPPTAVDEDSPLPAVSCTPASGSTFAIGTTTVTCTVSDSDDTPSAVSQTFTVTVKGAAQQISDLITTVQGLSIASGLKASLVDQLQTVLADLQANNTAQACLDLTSFINHVKAQSGKGLTTSQATQLLTAATRIKAVLAC